ncbi:MAG: DUF1772 domain-containing protein [Bacillota bacterium]
MIEQTFSYKKNLKGILLWLFVINLGIAVGAGLYEGRVVIPAWVGSSPQTWPNTGLLFWVYVTTVPLTLLTIANAIAAWKTQGPQRRWYMAAVAIIIIERIVTFSYFIPTMAGLMSTVGLSQGEIDATLSQWLLMDYGRHVLSISGWLLALKTQSISSASDRKS